MRVGVPKEVKSHEYRVGLVPGSVREFAHHGHDVIVETMAGIGIGFDDDAYRAVGATVVDTAAAPDQIIETIKAKGLKPAAIFLTHDHGDHIEGVDQVYAAFNVPTVMGEDMDAPKGLGKVVKMGERDSYKLGNLDVRLLKTPGHTTHCVTFVTGSVALSGDVIFAGSIGKPNISYDQVLSSNRDKVFSLPDNTRLFPGHGPSTTVGEEKAHNPFFG